MFTIEELIKIEQNKLNNMISEHGGNLLCKCIIEQSE